MRLCEFFIINLVLLFISCGSSRTDNVERVKVAPYHTIVASGGIEIHFSQGRSHIADIRKNDNINVTVRDGVLYLGRKGRSNNTVKAYLTTSNLESIVLSGGSKFISDELKSNGKFSITSSGGSKIKMNRIKADICNLTISGGSNCNIEKADFSIFNVASSGGSFSDIRAKDIGNINIASSGGSNVTMRGEANNISVSSSGNSKVNLSGLKYKNISSNNAGKSRIIP